MKVVYSAFYTIKAGIIYTILCDKNRNDTSRCPMIKMFDLTIARQDIITKCHEKVLYEMAKRNTDKIISWRKDDIYIFNKYFLIIYIASKILLKPL